MAPVWHGRVVSPGGVGGFVVAERWRGVGAVGVSVGVGVSVQA